MGSWRLVGGFSLATSSSVAVDGHGEGSGSVGFDSAMVGRPGLGSADAVGFGSV